jgi:hypothetical protein
MPTLTIVINRLQMKSDSSRSAINPLWALGMKGQRSKRSNDPLADMDEGGVGVCLAPKADASYLPFIRFLELDQAFPTPKITLKAVNACGLPSRKEGRQVDVMAPVTGPP